MSMTLHLLYIIYNFVLLNLKHVSLYIFVEIQLWNCYYLSPTEHRDFFLVTASRTAYYMAISVQTFMLFYFRDMVGSKV